MIRPAWQGDEQQKRLLQAAVKAVRQARSAEDAAWEAMQAARASGVPDEVLCSGTGISRSTLNRKLGKRPRKAEDVESYAEEVHVPESRIPEHPPGQRWRRPRRTSRSWRAARTAGRRRSLRHSHLREQAADNRGLSGCCVVRGRRGDDTARPAGEVVGLAALHASGCNASHGDLLGVLKASGWC